MVLAGPNGAGKSTAQPFLIPPTMQFVNADNIARDLRSAGTASGPTADIAAGRLLLRRIEELVEQRADFCTETNLANKSLAQRIPAWQKAGYCVGLYYLWVPSPEFAIARVAQRVLKGGHDVPEATIRRRYYIGLRSFFDLYVPIIDRWRLYDSSYPGNPVLIERGIRQIRRQEIWQQVKTLAYSKEAADALK